MAVKLDGGTKGAVEGVGIGVFGVAGKGMDGNVGGSMGMGGIRSGFSMFA